MTHTDLIHQIQDTILLITNRECIVPIHVRDLEPEGYEVQIEFRQYDPWCYSAQMSDDLFLKSLKEELRKCTPLRTSYAKAERNTNHYMLNNLISPYDTARTNG